MEENINPKKSIVQRALTGVILGFTALFCIIFGGFPLLVMLMLIIAIASKEYVQILKHKGFYPSLKVILIFNTIIAVLAYFNCKSLMPLVFTFGVIVSFMWVLFKGRQPYIANVATTLLGFLYLGWCPLQLLFLRDLGTNNTSSLQMIFKTNILSDGLWYVIFLLLLVIMTDVGCYYSGKFFGKHKLAPVISPNKTVEGAVGGAIAAVILGLVCGFFMGLPWYHSFIMGSLVTVFAQIGDLSESLIKRDAGVKDSGDLLPGHGGFLDRTDSYILTIPVLYYYCLYFVQSNDLLNNIIVFIKGIF